MTLLCRGAMSNILHFPGIIGTIINMPSRDTNFFGFRILYAQFGRERLPFSSIARNLSKDKRFTHSQRSFSTPFIDKHWAISARSVAKIQKEVKLPLIDLQEKVKSSAVILGELCGLDVEDVGHMVCKRPRILLLDDQQVKRCIKTLRNVGLKELNIATMLKKSPGILTSRIENSLEEKLEVLYNLEVHPPFSVKDVLKIITKCPTLVSTCTPASVEDKARFLLNEIGFYRHQLRKIIIRQPSVLTFSKENIKIKFDYCYVDMGVPMPEIAHCPRLWQCSLKRLKERHKYLEHLNIITDKVDGYQLERIVTLSDHHFVDTVALTSFTEFQDFLRLGTHDI